MSGFLAVVVLALALQDPPAEPQSGSGGQVSVVAWWEREPLCKRFGIPPELRLKLAGELDTTQTSYQLLQTRLGDARAVQSRLLLDPASTDEAIARHNRDEVARLSGAMQEQNFKARLLVRRALSREQLATIARELPDFFGGRWFRAPAARVQQGNVVIRK